MVLGEGLPVQFPGGVLLVAGEPDGQGPAAEVGGELEVVVPAVPTGLVGPPVVLTRRSGSNTMVPLSAVWPMPSAPPLG